MWGGGEGGHNPLGYVGLGVTVARFFIRTTFYINHTFIHLYLIFHWKVNHVVYGGGHFPSHWEILPSKSGGWLISPKFTYSVEIKLSGNQIKSALSSSPVQTEDLPL